MEINFAKRRRNACVAAAIAWIFLGAYSRFQIQNRTSQAALSIDPDTVDLMYELNEEAPPLEIIQLDRKPPQNSMFETLPKNNSDQIHILMLGFDSLGALPGRTDSMVIAAVRYSSAEVGLISIPRDVVVNIPDVGHGRINKVYRAGYRQSGQSGGRDLLKQVIKQELGIEIDYTVAVDFVGFRRMVDLLGGVDVEVECPIRDNFAAPNSQAGFEPLVVNAGLRRMDGSTALKFVRSRHGRGDMDRARRGQAVLLGLKRRIATPSLIIKLPALWSEVEKSVSTDLDFKQALRLAELAVSIDAKKIHGLVLRKPVVSPWKSADGKALLVLDRQELEVALGRLFEAPLPGIRKSRVCPRADAAINWKDRLHKDPVKDDLGNLAATMEI